MKMTKLMIKKKAITNSVKYACFMKSQIFWKRVKYLFGVNGLKIQFRNFLIIFGSIWLILESFSFLFKDIQSYLEQIVPHYGVLLLVLAVLLSLKRSFPKLYIEKSYRSSNTKICIKVGDILKEKCQIVIGDDQYFSSSGERDLKDSIKNQMIQKFYGSDYNHFQVDLEASLQKERKIVKYGNERTGKVKYPIGFTAILVKNGKRIFILANSYLKENKAGDYTETSNDLIISSLRKLWPRIRNEGNGEEFSVPVFGTGYSKTNISHCLMIQLIVCLYALYSKSNQISKKMNIVIHPENYDPGEMEALDFFLRSVRI